MERFSATEQPVTPRSIRIEVRKTKRWGIDLRLYRGREPLAFQRFLPPKGRSVEHMYQALRHLYFEQVFPCALSVQGQINYLMKRNGWDEWKQEIGS